MKKIFTLCTTILLGACGVFGHETVETPPYQSVAKPEKNIEIRNYPDMVMAVSPMQQEGNSEQQKTAFMSLFRYISGDNTGSEKIAMTAPVLMNNNTAQDDGAKIDMTAPVLMNNGVMAFILPSQYTIDTAPQPTADNVVLKERSLGTVAVITFNGRLGKHAASYTQILNDWIVENNYKAVGEPIRAGYNPPYTLPIFRRNEILIPVAKY